MVVARAIVHRTRVSLVDVDADELKPPPLFSVLFLSAGVFYVLFKNHPYNNKNEVSS